MANSKASRKAGLPPGSLVFVGEQRVEKTTISIIDYNADTLTERTVASAADCRPYRDSDTVSWINLTGLHEPAVVEGFGTIFDIHPLVIEDILHTNQRPKMEDHGDYIFIVMRMIYRDPSKRKILAEQVSFILGHNTLLTFQEVEGDVFGLIRQRIREAKGRVRREGADYMAYALIDAIVDNYFVVLEEIGEQLETLQERVIEHPDPEVLHEAHRLRREMIFLRKNLWPVRELVSALEKSGSPLIAPATGPYLRDVYEHSIQVVDTMESMRDLLTSALDMYMTSVGNRMNEIMRVLTVIATIFIPLTFIAGVYGMNFRHMPELAWRFGYPGVWLIMILVALAMLAYFRRQRWL